MSVKKDPDEVQNVRMHFLISRRMRWELSALMMKAEDTSVSTTIRRAIRFYGKIVMALADGGTVVIRTKDGKEKEVLVT